MIIDKGHWRWGATTLVLAAGATALYLYERASVTGLSGGSVPGLILGIAGSAMIVFAALLGVRRKFRALRLGRSAAWLKGHIWLGALTILLILYHGGFAFGGPLTTVLMVLLILVVGSGFLGIALQQFMPRLMTEQLPLETIYEEIPHVCEQLRAKADELATAVCGNLDLAPAEKGAAPRPTVPVAGVADPLEGSERLKTFYTERLRPYLGPKGSGDRDLARKETAQNIFEYLRVELGQPFYDTLEQLAEICEERRQLYAQARMHLVLHGWLLVHMPLTMALLVLGFVHALWALRY